MNRFVAQLVGNGGKRSRGGRATVESLRQSMRNMPADFWSVVGQTELDVYEAIRKRNLAGSVDALIADFRKHYSDVSAPRMWASVADNARFVLSAYAAAATPTEAAAAENLLGMLLSLRRINESETKA
jgi:hypothetical protein